MVARRKMRPVPLKRVAITGGLLEQRQTVNRERTLPANHKQLLDTGRIDAFRLQWKPGQPNEPHRFWDSDVAKWMEGAAYSLATNPDPKLEAELDRIIELIAASQQADGYLNSHFTAVEPENRWTDLRRAHELYCAGHLIEAAVAYAEATGKTRFLDTLRRYADYIDSVFGDGKGRRPGAPGHEEIELALIKLYRLTGERRYATLAAYFLDARCKPPSVFRREAPEMTEYDESLFQAHKPVREQTEAVGHAVRAMYLYCGMADVAAETGDDSLLKPLKKLWRSVTGRRMYVTGGIGSEVRGERFTFDYDAPNDIGYAETCAAIGLVFWAHRMLHLDPDRRYADVMERALYNGVLSGLSHDGERFFYTNPLEVDPEATAKRATHSPIVVPRQGWFRCACCPTNVVRLLASLGEYAYSTDSRTIWVHLYTDSRAEVDVAGRTVTLVQRTDYPWRERVRFTVWPDAPGKLRLALRLPGWCRKPGLTVNGRAVRLGPITRKGYAILERKWQPGDRVELTLPMPVERVEAHPSVRTNCGRVALMRGPIVYCLEETDNGPDLQDIALPRDAKLRARFEKDLLGGVVVVTGKAKRRRKADWGKDELYRTEPTKLETVALRAVPYFAWENRGLGEMTVWIREV